MKKKKKEKKQNQSEEKQYPLAIYLTGQSSRIAWDHLYYGDEQNSHPELAF